MMEIVGQSCRRCQVKKRVGEVGAKRVTIPMKSRNSDKRGILKRMISKRKSKVNFEIDDEEHEC